MISIEELKLNPELIYDIPDNEIDLSFAYSYFKNTKTYNYKLRKFLNNNDFVMFMLSIDIRVIDKIYDFIDNSVIKNNVLDYLEEKDFLIDLDQMNFDFLSREKIVYNNILKRKNPDIINFCKLTKISDELAELLIKLKYKPSVLAPSVIYSNEKLMLYFISLNPNLFNKALDGAITERTINFAKENKFEFDKDSNLLNNSKALMFLVRKNPDIINYANESGINIDVARIAREHNFVYKFIGDRDLTAIYNGDEFSEDVLYKNIKNNLFLLNYKDLVLSSFDNGYKDIILKEDIDSSYNDIMLPYIISNKIKPVDVRNTKLLNDSRFKDYVYNTYFNDSLSKDVLNILLKQYPYKEVVFNLYKISILLNKNFINIFGLSNSLMIIKYIVIPKDKLLIEDYNIDELDTINKLLNIEQDSSKLFAFNFAKYINYFSTNKSLLNDIKLNINNLSNIDINNIKCLIESGIACNNIKDISNTRYNYYNNLDIDTKSKVYEYLFNTDIKDIDLILKNKLNTYKICIFMLKGINIDDKLINIIKTLEYFNDLDNDSFNNIWNNIDNYEVIPVSKIKELIKSLYFDMYKEKITNLKKSDVSYQVDGVDVYEYNGEKFSFIVHYLNSFATGYQNDMTIYDSYTNNYGKSYICTSFINEFNMSVASSKSSSLFGYNYFSKEQLFAMSNRDIMTNASSNNTLNISHIKGSYYDPDSMSYMTNDYNEMDFIRQNNTGERMIPSCLIFFDKMGDVKVAKALNIPVVLIHTEYYKRDFLVKEFNTIKEEIRCNNYSRINDFIGIASKLKYEFTKEDIELMFNNNKYQQIVEYLFKIYNVKIK